MPLLSKDLLKSFFESGDRPTSVQFASLIDSMMHLYDDRHRIGLRVYEASRSYIPGDTTLFDNSLFVCITETTGIFQPGHWQPVMSAGAVTYMGTWNAQTNTPSLQSNTGVKGQYYVVTVAGNTSVNGITDWQVGDWIIYNGSQWQKVDNTDSGAALVAGDVLFTPVGVITSTNTQSAIEQLLTWITSQLSGKADAFSGTTGNVVSFDVQQRPVDSGLGLNLVPRLVNGTATNGNFISSKGGNEVQDSGVSAASFMPAGAVASDIPITPSSPFSASNVQAMFDEVNGLFMPKVPGAINGNIPLFSDSTGLSDSNKKLSDFLAKDNTTSFTPSADFHPATKKYVDDAGANFLAKNNTTSFTPTADFHPATKKYADDNFLSRTNSGIYVPSEQYHPATKKYVDDADANFLSKTNAGSYTPSADFHPATKKYVDDNGKKVVITHLPIAIAGVGSTTTSTWTRLGLMGILPDFDDLFPNTTSVEARVRFGYKTPAGVAGELSIVSDPNGTTLTPPANSVVAAPASVTITQTVTSNWFSLAENSFIIPAFRRTSTTSGALTLHSVVLILRFT